MRKGEDFIDITLAAQGDETTEVEEEQAHQQQELLTSTVKGDRVKIKVGRYRGESLVTGETTIGVLKGKHKDKHGVVIGWLNNNQTCRVQIKPSWTVDREEMAKKQAIKYAARVVTGANLYPPALLREFTVVKESSSLEGGGQEKEKDGTAARTTQENCLLTGITVKGSGSMKKAANDTAATITAEGIRKGKEDAPASPSFLHPYLTPPSTIVKGSGSPSFLHPYLTSPSPSPRTPTNNAFTVPLLTFAAKDEEEKKKSTSTNHLLTAGIDASIASIKTDATAGVDADTLSDDEQNIEDVSDAMNSKYDDDDDDGGGSGGGGDGGGDNGSIEDHRSREPFIAEPLGIDFCATSNINSSHDNDNEDAASASGPALATATTTSPTTNTATVVTPPSCAATASTFTSNNGEDDNENEDENKLEKDEQDATAATAHEPLIPAELDFGSSVDGGFDGDSDGDGDNSYNNSKEEEETGDGDGDGDVLGEIPQSKEEDMAGLFQDLSLDEKTPALSSEDLSVGVASISSATVSTIDNVGDKTTKDNDDIVLDEEQNNEAITDIMIEDQAEEEKEDQEVNESRYIYYDKTFTKTKLGLKISQHKERDEIFVSKIYDNKHKGTIEVNDVVVAIGTISLATLHTSTTTKLERVKQLIAHQTQRPLTIKFSKGPFLEEEIHSQLSTYLFAGVASISSATASTADDADADVDADIDDRDGYDMLPPDFSDGQVYLRHSDDYDDDEIESHLRWILAQPYLDFKFESIGSIRSRWCVSYNFDWYTLDKERKSKWKEIVRRIVNEKKGDDDDDVVPVVATKRKVGIPKGTKKNTVRTPKEWNDSVAYYVKYYNHLFQNEFLNSPVSNKWYTGIATPSVKNGFSKRYRKYIKANRQDRKANRQGRKRKSKANRQGRKRKRNRKAEEE